MQNLEAMHGGIQVSDVLVKFVLDRSASMASIWEQTIGGFNEFKNDQAKNKGDTYITLTTFDLPSGLASWTPRGSTIPAVKRDPKPAIETVIQAKKATEVEDLDPKGNIQPRGSTPLIDAVCRSIEEVDDWLAWTENENFDGKVIVVINTDGEENASTEFTLEDLRTKIKNKTEAGWEFVFMGAGIDAYADAAKYGIDTRNAVAYAATGEATQQTYSLLSRSVTGSRDGKFGWENKDENTSEVKKSKRGSRRVSELDQGEQG